MLFQPQTMAIKPRQQCPITVAVNFMKILTQLLLRLKESFFFEKEEIAHGVVAYNI